MPESDARTFPAPAGRVQCAARRGALVAGGALAWPLLGRAQGPALPIIGFLNGGSPGLFAHLLAGFRQGLGEVVAAAR